MIDRVDSHQLPSRHAVAELHELARASLHLGRRDADQLEGVLREQIRRALALREHPTPAAAAASHARFLVEHLDDLRAATASDVEAAFDGDPALESREEALLCSPGLTALLAYRVAHLLHQLDVPLLPRMLCEHAHSLTGIDIHPAARIGERLFIDHGTGVVIGATAVLGDNVRLYQGVTLGAKRFPVGEDGRLVKGRPRHPILEDDVVVYSGASILGRVTIGRGAVIGGNVWVTRDVAPGTVVTQARVTSTEFSHGGGI